MLDLIPPLALLLLSLGIAGTLGGKVRQLPLPGLALTCLIAPTLYAVGMLLYLLGDKWKPGMGVGSLLTTGLAVAVQHCGQATVVGEAPRKNNPLRDILCVS